MTRLPFIVTHDGWSANCNLLIDAAKRVIQIEVARARQEGEGPQALLKELRARAELLNDLLHAETPFAVLASCRRSPGLFGAILDPAASAYEALGEVLEAFGGGDVA